MRHSGIAFLLFAGLIGAAPSCNPPELAAPQTERTPVAVQTNDSRLTPGMIQFRDAWLAVRNDAEMTRFLTEVERNLDGYSPDVKVIANLILPMKVWRAAVWRGSAILERVRITQNAALIGLRSGAAAQAILLPTEQWKAVQDFLVKPAADLLQWNSVDDFQAWQVAELAPVLERMVAALKALEPQVSEIVFDNRILYGPASFQDDLDRFRVLGRPEILGMIAMAEAGLQGIHASSAFRGNELPELSERVYKAIGLDGVFLGVLDGFSSMQRTSILRESRFANLFQLKPEGRERLRSSFAHFKEAIHYTRLAYDALKARPNQSQQLVQAAALLPFDVGTELALKNLEAMVQGPASIRSIVTGEVVTVNLPAFFENPPSDLKALLPRAWIDKPEMLSANGKSYRNPDFGQATDWNLSAFKPYFPSVNSAADLKTAARVLSQAWAGNTVALPLLAVLM